MTLVIVSRHANILSLGPSWDARGGLEPSWRNLAAVLTQSWVGLGLSWAVLEHLVAILGSLGAV